MADFSQSYFARWEINFRREQNNSSSSANFLDFFLKETANSAVHICTSTSDVTSQANSINLSQRRCCRPYFDRRKNAFFVVINHQDRWTFKPVKLLNFQWFNLSCSEIRAIIVEFRILSTWEKFFFCVSRHVEDAVDVLVVERYKKKITSGWFKVPFGFPLCARLFLLSFTLSGFLVFCVVFRVKLIRLRSWKLSEAVISDLIILNFNFRLLSVLNTWHCRAYTNVICWENCISEELGSERLLLLMISWADFCCFNKKL